jgi:hypothetical protein
MALPIPLIDSEIMIELNILIKVRRIIPLNTNPKRRIRDCLRVFIGGVYGEKVVSIFVIYISYKALLYTIK